MADPRFFERAAATTLLELTQRCACRLGDEGNSDAASFTVEDVAPLSEAGATHLSFLDNRKYRDQLRNTRAGAVIVHPAMADLVPAGCYALLSENPYKSYALAAQYFYPETKPDASISGKAMIAGDVEIGEGAVIEDGVIIKSSAVIGRDAWLQSGAIIGQNVRIGDHVRIGENAVVSHAILGNHVRLYPGACIGQDGFGFAIDPAGYVKVPQLGRVLIEDFVQIGANTTIDRGAGPDTIIGAGTWIDNLVQIGHNVKIGKACIIVAGTGIAGSSELGDYVVLGGQVGIAGHLKVGTGARIGAQAGITRNIPAGQNEYWGTPAVPIREHLKQLAALKRLIKKDKSV